MLQACDGYGRSRCLESLSTQNMKHREYFMHSAKVSASTSSCGTHNNYSHLEQSYTNTVIVKKVSPGQLFVQAMRTIIVKEEPQNK